MAIPIPGYLGQVQVATIGDAIGDGQIFPYVKLQWYSGCNIDTLYTATSSPYPDCFPGFQTPGVFECIGFWNDEFNPFDTTPILQVGQTIQAQVSSWVDNYDAYAQQCFVASVDFIGEVNKTMAYHIVLVANWTYEGTASSTLVRDQGGDNDAGDYS